MEAAQTASPDIANWVDLPMRVAMVAHGVRIGFGADSDEALDQMKATLPPGARPARDNGVDVSYTLGAGTNPAQPGVRELIGAVDGEELLRSTDSGAVLQSLERHIHLHVAEHAPRRVFVHAGVVGWNGRGVVIPGTSYSGKSTLVAALVDAGATYYSDEYAVVDSAGRVHPYLQPIQLRDALGFHDPLATAKVSLVKGKEILTIGLVLVTSFRRGARWRPQRVSAGTGMLALLANTVSARRDPRRALRNLTRMLDGACVLRGTRGEAPAVVRQLLRYGYLAP
jgi:hypothetical protein